MLKLLKYEMIQNYRSFAAIFAIFLIACFSLPFLPMNAFEIANTVMVFVVTGISISIFVTIIKGYYSSMFQKPGYLTLTLPMSTHQIVLSKIIAAFIWWTLTIVVICFGMLSMITIYSVKNLNQNVIEQTFEVAKITLSYLGLYNIQTVLIILLNILTSLMTSITGLFALVTIVQTKYTRKHKVLAGFGIYVLYSIIINFVLNRLIYPNDIAYNFTYTTLGQVFYIGILVSIIQVVIYYFVTIYIVNNKIEIE